MGKPHGSSFTITTTWGGTRRWWIVRIHPDVENLRRAAARYHPGMDFSETAGVCQAAIWIDDDGEYVRYGENGYAGVIRFAPPFIVGEIVAHELLHAAVATYRMTFDRNVHLGQGVDEREENLAYIYGELYADFESRFEHPAP